MNEQSQAPHQADIPKLEKRIDGLQRNLVIVSTLLGLCVLLLAVAALQISYASREELRTHRVVLVDRHNKAVGSLDADGGKPQLKMTSSQDRAKVVLRPGSIRFEGTGDRQGPTTHINRSGFSATDGGSSSVLLKPVSGLQLDTAEFSATIAPGHLDVSANADTEDEFRYEIWAELMNMSLRGPGGEVKLWSSGITSDSAETAGVSACNDGCYRATEITPGFMRIENPNDKWIHFGERNAISFWQDNSIYAILPR